MAQNHQTVRIGQKCQLSGDIFRARLKHIEGWSTFCYISID